ncbi:MAG: sugar transferase [Thermostichales cyanobacterium HHBFW_bins_127]
MGAKSLDITALWLWLAGIGDGLAVLAAWPLAYGIRSLVPHSLLPLDVYMGFGILSLGCYWGVGWSLGCYRQERRLSAFDELLTALTALGLSMGLVLGAAFFIRSLSLSRLLIVYATVLSSVGILASRGLWRAWLYRCRRRGLGLKDVLWVGHHPALADVVDRLHHCPQLGFRLVGYVAPAPFPIPSDYQDLPFPPWVATPTTWQDYLQQHPNIAEIWFGDPPGAAELWQLQYHSCRPYRLRVVPHGLGVITTHLTLSSLDGIPMLTLQDPPLRQPWNRLQKRLLDIVGSLLGLVVLSPVLLVVAVGVKLSSPGPIFYRQERLSLDGERFWIYKFRSMRVDAEADHQPGWTTADDPRRTRFGKFLRATNLDELPQLWNVLMGDMSLVGPRPERPYFVAQFQQQYPRYLDRHLVKSGMTGWAQIHGWRGDTSIARRTQYDLYYVQHWSLLLDLRILALTFWQTLQGRIWGT